MPNGPKGLARERQRPLQPRLEASEGHASGYPNNVAAVHRALEAVGVEFTNGGQPGVRLRKKFESGDVAKATEVGNVSGISMSRDRAGYIIATTDVVLPDKRK
jgi:hypothetical protein